VSSKLIEIFNDEKLISKIKSRLPHFFQLAELESSRAGKIGMEVGSLREKIITALLIYKFGKENVEDIIEKQGILNVEDLLSAEKISEINNRLNKNYYDSMIEMIINHLQYGKDKK